MGEIATAQPVASSDWLAGCSGQGRGNQCYWQHKGCGVGDSVMEFVWDLVVFLVMFAAGLVVLGLLARMN
jgi:hypothetical protein